MYTVLIPEKADSCEGMRDRFSEREKETYITKYTKLYNYLYDFYALHFEFSFMLFFLRLTAFLFQIHEVCDV